MPPSAEDRTPTMSATDKIGEAMRRSLPLLPADARQVVEAMLTPKSLAIIGGTLVGWMASHFFGVGEVVDVNGTEDERSGVGCEGVSIPCHQRLCDRVADDGRGSGNRHDHAGRGVVQCLDLGRAEAGRPMITREEAIAIAVARAQAQGWGLREPLAVTLRRSWSGKPRHYQIASDPAMRGTKTRFTIDAATGAILDEGYLAR